MATLKNQFLSRYFPSIEAYVGRQDLVGPNLPKLSLPLMYRAMDLKWPVLIIQSCA